MAPAAVKDFLRRYYMRYSGPAGMTEQDDVENWLYATEASRGTIALRYPFYYQQSIILYKFCITWAISRIARVAEVGSYAYQCYPVAPP